MPIVVNWVEGGEPQRLFSSFGDWLEAEVAAAMTRFAN